MGDAAPPRPRPPPLSRDERDLVIVRKMFIGGLFLLPWLWAMCLLKFGIKRLVDRDTDSRLQWCEC